MERYPRLRDLREDADLTQAQVGQALHLTQRAYAYYESGQRMLPPQVLCALARYYGVSVDYLLGETDVRALSGGEKAVRDRSAPPETAGFSKPFQPAHPAPPRKKPPLRSERRFFIRFSVGPRLQRAARDAQQRRQQQREHDAFSRADGQPQR